MSEITYKELRQQRRERDFLLSEIESELQHFAGLLTAEYIKSLYLPKSNGARHGRPQPEDYVHIGLDNEGQIEWSNSYSRLVLDEDKRMFFPIRTLLGEDTELGSDEAIIYCILSLEKNLICIELQCEDGQTIQTFKFTRTAKKEALREVVTRIKTHIYSLLQWAG